MKKVWVIIRREYLVRVRTRAFVIGTIVSPLFLLGLIVLPALLAERSSGGQRLVTVIDQSGDPDLFPTIKERMESQGSVVDWEGGNGPGRGTRFVLESKVVPLDQNPSDFIKRESNDDADPRSEKAYLILGSGVLDGVEPEYHAKNLSDFSIRSLEESVSAAISERRLMRAGFDAAKIEKYMKPVDLKIFKVGARGESKAGGVRQDFMVAFALLFFLYISVLFYGLFVMRGVIEEKQSRIVEIVISSVRPTQMMIGKLIGIGLVGLTQIGIWAISAAMISMFGARLLSSRESQIPTIPTSLLLYFVLYFILGFFLFATLYAIVGAIVSSEEDAQQVQFPVTMLIVVPMMIFGIVMSNPNSTSSIVLSLVPFFAPTLMMLRISVTNPPVWQIILSMLIMVMTILVFLWVAAKIYRVGILMYGKRPSLAELGRWLRYT
jgi:ABC-2 type transport system permease protein